MVKVCGICGDPGYTDLLRICNECNKVAEHVYCMQTLSEIDPGIYWSCEECIVKRKATEQKVSLVLVDPQGAQSPSSNVIPGKQSNIEKLKIASSGQSCQISSKRHRDNASCPQVNKKQALESSNVVTNPYQRDNSLSGSGATNDEIHVGSQQMRGSDGPFGVPKAGKLEPGSIKSFHGSSDSALPSLLRENSLKKVEMPKGKLLPTTTSFNLSRVSSSKGTATAPCADRDSGAVNKLGPRSASQLAPVTSAFLSSGLKSTVLAKHGNSLPSVLVSSRPTISPRGQVAFTSNKEVDSGSRQSSVAAELSGSRTSEGKFRGSIATVRAHVSSIPVSEQQNDVAQANPVVNVDANGIGGSPENSFEGSLTIHKSDTDLDEMSLISMSENCRSNQALASIKGNLGVTLAAEELKFSTVRGEDANRLESTSGKLMVSAMPKKYPERLVLADGLKELVPPLSLNLDKEASKCLRLIKGDTVEHGLGMDPKCLAVLEVEKDDCRGLTGEDQTVLPLLKENMIGLSPVTNAISKKCMEGSACPKEDGLVLSKESKLLQVQKKEPKDLISSKDDFQGSMLFHENPKITASSKVVSPVIVEEQISMNIDELNKMSVCQNGIPQSTKCLSDTMVSSLDELKSGEITGILRNGTTDVVTEAAPVKFASAADNTKLSQRKDLGHSSQARSKTSSSLAGAAFQTSLRTVNKRARGSTNSIEPDSVAREIESGRPDTSSGALNDGTRKPTNEFGRTIAKDAPPSPAPTTFGRERSVDIGAQTPPQFSVFGSPQQESLTLPTSQILWKGGFEVINKPCGPRIYDGIQAHPSNKASSKVYEVTEAFLSYLRMEQVKRSDAWPKRFQESPPTDKDIALYFLPAEIERCERAYAKLLEDTIKCDLAMRVCLDNAELLIFSSIQLPECYHRFNGKLYLWGVFRGSQKASSVHNPQQSFTHSNHGGVNVVRSESSVPLSSNSIEDPTREPTFSNMHENGSGEDMDVDMVGGREVSHPTIPVPRTDSRLAQLSTRHSSELSLPLNSQTDCIPPVSTLLIQQNAKSGEHALLKQDLSVSVSSRIKSERTLEKTREQVCQTTVKSINRANEQACWGSTNKELDGPSGLYPSHRFCHPQALHRKGSRRSPEVMHDKRNMCGKRLHERELPAQSRSRKRSRGLRGKKYLPGSGPQNQNCQPGGLQIQEFPPGFVSVSVKPKMPFVHHPLEKQGSKDFQAGLNSKSESQKEIDPRIQHLAYSSRQENSSRDHVKRPCNSHQASLSSGQSNCSYGNRWLSLSAAPTPADRQVDSSKDTLKMSKSRSLKENNYCTRRRGEEEERERREHTNRGNETDRERESHGHKRKYSGIRVAQMQHQRRAYDHVAKRGFSHSRSHSRSCSYSHSCSQLPKRSCSPSSAMHKYLGDGKSVSCHSYSADERSSPKRLTQVRDSASGGQIRIRNCLEKSEAPMDNDCRQEKCDEKSIQPEVSLLEVEEGCSIVRSREASAGQEQMTKDQWSFTPLHNLIDETTENRNVSEVSNAASLLESSEQICSGENVPRELMEADLSGLVDLTNHTSRSGLVEWPPMEERGIWSAALSLKQADIKPVTCLELFPLEEENLGLVKSIVNDSDINLDLGLGRQNSKKGLLPVFEEASARQCYNDSISDNESCPDRSMLDYNNSCEGSPDVRPLLSLSLPCVKKGRQYLD